MCVLMKKKNIANVILHKNCHNSEAMPISTDEQRKVVFLYCHEHFRVESSSRSAVVLFSKAAITFSCISQSRIRRINAHSRTRKKLQKTI